jgi:hypothetical protein
MNFMPQGRRRSRLRFGGDGRRARLDRFADLADEADALALHRADQALRPAAVADGLAHGVDAAGQR